MSDKLTKAVRAWAWMTPARVWAANSHPSPPDIPTVDVFLVPAAEYQRLKRLDKKPAKRRSR